MTTKKKKPSAPSAQIKLELGKVVKAIHRTRRHLNRIGELTRTNKIAHIGGPEATAFASSLKAVNREYRQSAINPKTAGRSE